MARKLEKGRVSLNQIRNFSHNPTLTDKKGIVLIDAFLPQWSNDPFLTQKSKDSTVTANVNLFCSGNRKQDRLGNARELDCIVVELTNNASFINDALHRCSTWISGTPPITKGSSIFTELVPTLKSCDHLSAEIDCQFDIIRATIDTLREQNTPDSLTYALFLLVLVGVLQERIVQVAHVYDTSRSTLPQLKAILPKANRRLIANAPASVTELTPTEPAHEKLQFLHQGGFMFVYDAVQQYASEEIASIDMAFHGGDHWLRDGEKVDLLGSILDKGIHVRVIVNSEEAIKEICQHMRQKRQKYMGFDAGIRGWKEWESYFPGRIEVRISPLPLLHRVYLVRKKDGSGLANITCYAYGHYTPKNDLRLCLDSNHHAYTVLANEFDYLWTHAEE